MRLRLFTKNPLQRKYLVLIVLSILLPILILGACLYYLIFQIMAEQLAIPESIAYNLFPVVNKINMLLLVGIPPIMLILVIWGAVLTHRLIGPLERLEEDLKKISKGDYSIRLKLRKDDDLKPIADVVNGIIAKLIKGDNADRKKK